MSALEITLGVILLIMSVAIVAVVLFQEGHQKNMGAMTGSVSDTFLTKNKSRSIDAFLERWTKVISVGFFIAVIAINALMFFHVIG
ncbi:MAG: preprotein translocase subunit SecG [Acutalibacteraceae bacterium]